MERNWSPNALAVLESRYLWKDSEGKLLEKPGDLFGRVARAIAEPEGRQAARWEERFSDMMLSRRFMPNTPTLMNAGKPGGQLSACFVLPVGDSLDEIFETLKHAAKIHQSGGGTGFAFSNLRPSGALVKSTHGVASGPVSFIRIFDVATETIKQGGARRGANMAVLRVDHPDILEFIDSKRDLKSIVNFNISVGATGEFMEAVLKKGPFALRDPKTGKEVRTVQAEELFERIAQAAWESGDPGLVFLDRVNFMNPTPNVGPMESTNPCGEQPLLPYESCNLGSLNLSLYVDNGNFDWSGFREDIATAVRFLDNVIDVNHYPVKECERITHRNRKIGLGVMGFADLLLSLELPYDSEAAVEVGERVMSFLDREAKIASMTLAEERGAFPNFRGSLWDRLGYAPMRNATVSTVAPTGTISIIAGASSGIEPIFSAVFYRNILSGARLIDVHPAVATKLMEKGISIEGLTEEKVAHLLGRAWSPAHSIPIEGHVRMQSAFQRHSDSAVSKTINLAQSASVADVRRSYLEAYRHGCKGITIYRDRSRPSQVLDRTPQVGPEDEDAPAAAYCPSC
ncbi:MAG TPA: adenosylcobalamin-dependent ribonucleoside-diphosphate reductase [Bdellovibrionota bacterium]|nr:adenosylcobalamin-dependent ribonucleoside-diphosphate reductase [Bdellovibrionota bacterium]